MRCAELDRRGATRCRVLPGLADPSERRVTTLAELLHLQPEPGWSLVEEGPPGPREHEIESIFAIANGGLGSRASLEEGGPLSNPATFAAGVFAIDAESGIPTIARLPDWSRVEVFVDDRRLSLDVGRVREHRRVLDLKRALLWREWRQEDSNGGVTRVVSLHFASLADRHVLAQSVIVTPENCSTNVRVAACAAQSGDRVTIATSFQPHPPLPANNRSDDAHTACWSCRVPSGESVRLDRVVSIRPMRDATKPSQEPAATSPEDTPPGELDSQLQRHVAAWSERWKAADVRIEGDDDAQRALRFAIYHLLSASNPDDDYTSIGARGLTGLAYRGHVFWDTEIYMMPFFLFAEPASARALLMYRYHTLDGARRKAEAQGYKGALYAWESADTGDETTPRTARGPNGEVIPILTGELEHHISADVAYAVWQYWRATGDEEFMTTAGVEILVETARFWASRARIEADGAAHIRRVIGPDEYHAPVDDSAYTNGMARWNLHRAAEMVAALERVRSEDGLRLRRRLSLTDDEPNEWRKTGDALVTGFHRDSNLFEQFAGFFDLENVDVQSYRQCPMPIDVYLGRDRVQRVQAIKQPDVVALSALLWDEYPIAVHEANFQYYEPRTAHGSSLSPSLSALVAARLGHGAQAMELFRTGSAIDLADNQGLAAGGVHMGALGGLWQAAVLGMAGLHLRDDGIALDPRLPRSWSALEFPARWHGRALVIRMSGDPLEVEVGVLDGGELTLSIVGGPACHARSGTRYTIRRERDGWGAWREHGG